MPTVLIAHNLEYQLLAQQLTDYPFLSPILQREITKQRRYEIEGFRRSRGVIFVSAPEMAWGCTKVPGLRALHVPPLFTDPPTRRTLLPGNRLRLGFLADFAWWPNRRNWMWLIDDILPKVHRPLEVHIFGRKSQEMPAGNRVVAHGLVPDLGAVWDQVDLMMCPIRTGAGVSIKVAESLYNRMPVLATTQAIRGFQAFSGPGLVVIDSAEDWISFLNSPEADQLATQVPSEEISRQFSVDQHVQRLDDFIMNVTIGRKAS